MKTTVKWMGILAGFGLMLAACDSGGGGTAVSETDLTGKWSLEKSTSKGSFSIRDANGKVLFSSNIDTTVTYPPSVYYLELKADHNYTANFPADPGLGIGKVAAAALKETGTWSVSGNTITTITTEGDTVKTQAAISGKSGTFTVSNHATESDEEGSFVTDFDNTFYATKE